MPRCPHYEEEIYEGVVAQVFCENPETVSQVRNGEIAHCPYTTEYECDIPIHLKNLKKEGLND